MPVFRLSKMKYAKSLDGQGAYLYGGRWNPKGIRMVYTAGSRSLSVLEKLVHLDPENLPDDLAMLTLNFPDNLKHEEYPIENLPQNWRDYQAPFALQEIGREWVEKNETAVLRMPSVVIPEEFNYMLNPAHKDFGEITVEAVDPFQFDPRLM